MKNNLIQMIYEDIGFEDLTSNALIPPNIKIKGEITTKEDGIVAGIDISSVIMNEFGIQSFIKKFDGDMIKTDEIIMEIEGDARSILSVERTIMNLMMRMSGIATATSKIVNMAKQVNPKITIAGTRKTTPGLQFLEKRAIKAGGGDTHRYRLDDLVLIKDNHLKIVGDVSRAIKKAKKYVSFTKKIEVEVETLKDANDAIKAGADILMLDNMCPNEINEVLKMLKNENLRDKIIIEASGGINPDNIIEYAKTNVDIISTGYITHSAKSLNMALEVI
jgi:nicotinate-nucleotide pyrophosphorylase (carboxylating)